jgi:hypothetical protein
MNEKNLRNKITRISWLKAIRRQCIKSLLWEKTDRRDRSMSTIESPLFPVTRGYMIIRQRKRRLFTRVKRVHANQTLPSDIVSRQYLSPGQTMIILSFRGDYPSRVIVYSWETLRMNNDDRLLEQRSDESEISVLSANDPLIGNWVIILIIITLLIAQKAGKIRYQSRAHYEDRWPRGSMKYYRESEKPFGNMIDTYSCAFDMNLKCLAAQRESRKRHSCDLCSILCCHREFVIVSHE